MKLKEYIDALNKFATDHPETLQMKVVSSKDDEGNGYNEVHYGPSAGIYEDREFTSEESHEENEEDYKDDEDYEPEEFKPNAVCIN
jgi:hypothetical protein